MSRSFLAAGNIPPARFLNMPDSAGNDYSAQLATVSTGQPPLGISEPADRYAPGTAFDNLFAATAGLDVMVIQEGEEGLLETGGAVTGGDMLMPDANGRGITCTNGNYYGARALESASASGTRIRVQVVIGFKVN